jgi:hypothetical protein
VFLAFLSHHPRARSPPPPPPPATASGHRTVIVEPLFASRTL